MLLDPTDIQELQKPQRSRISVERLVMDFAVLFGGMLLSVQLRLQLPLGKYLPPEYHAQTIPLYALLFGAALIAHLLAANLKASAPLLSNAHPYRRFVMETLAAALAILVILPDISQLQVGYFVLVSVLLGIICIALPFRIYHTETSIFTDLKRVVDNWALLRIWLSFNIQTRYSQRLLGILWIAIIPISTAIVLTIAFTQFMRIQLDVPFIAFYLAALVPYNVFANGVMFGTASVTGKIGLITQVYFPREILVLLTLGELIVDFLFTFLAMMLINLLYGLLPNVYFLFLPLLLLVHLVTTLGAMLIVSSLSVIVRDIPQLISVFLQLFFFLTPVIYPVETIPEQFRFLFVLNPIAAVIQAFRDIIVYGRAPNPVTLYYPIVFAGAILILGYATFKSIEDEMADIL